MTPDTAISLRSENADNNSLDTVHAGLHKLAGYLENIVLLGDQIILNVGGGGSTVGLNGDLTQRAIHFLLGATGTVAPLKRTTSTTSYDPPIDLLNSAVHKRILRKPFGCR